MLLITSLLSVCFSFETQQQSAEEPTSIHGNPSYEQVSTSYPMRWTPLLSAFANHRKRQRIRMSGPFNAAKKQFWNVPCLPLSSALSIFSFRKMFLFRNKLKFSFKKKFQRIKRATEFKLAQFWEDYFNCVNVQQIFCFWSCGPL